MIQQNIHQIWFQDNNNFQINTDYSNKKYIINRSNAPTEVKQFMINLVKINNKFNYILWCERNIEDLIKKNYSDYFNHFQKMTLIQKIDFSKIIILHAYGGIYLDCDIKPLKSFEKLITNLPSNNLIVSKSAKLFYLENKILEKIFNLNHNVKVNNGVIISSKNNKILLDFCDFIISRINNTNNGIISNFLTNNNQIETMRTTGPASLTSFVNKNQNKIIILDNKLFEPCLGADPFCKETIDSYGIHLHKSYWFNNGNFWKLTIIYFLFRYLWIFLFGFYIFYILKNRIK